MDSTLSPHTDHSEFDLDSPLISVSLGQSALFLVGGTSREDEPIAMFLRSGDVAVMMGPSRVAFHAVPRVLHCEPQYFQDCFSIVLPKEDRDDEAASVEVGTNLSQHPTTTDEMGAETLSKYILSAENMRLLQNQMRRTLTDLQENDSWKPFEEYLLHNRINMNIRQVHKNASASRAS